MSKQTEINEEFANSSFQILMKLIPYMEKLRTEANASFLECRNRATSCVTKIMLSTSGRPMIDSIVTQLNELKDANAYVDEIYAAAKKNFVNRETSELIEESFELARMYENILARFFEFKNKEGSLISTMDRIEKSGDAEPTQE